MRRRNHQQATPLRNPLELFERNSRAKFLMSAPKPKRREVRSGSRSGPASDIRAELIPDQYRIGGTQGPRIRF